MRCDKLSEVIFFPWSL